jgi:NADH-quinone oxidoreductase subunit H
MFFLAEYINMVTVSALATTLFLGGWHAPWPIHYIWAGCNSGWFPLIWFVLKVVAIIFVFVWLRGTLPRMRYDQFMHLGWKVLIPINLAWIMLIASVHVLRSRGWPAWEVAVTVGIPTLVVLLVWAIAADARNRRDAIAEAELEEAEARLGPAFPTPPLNLVVPKAPAVARASRARASLPRATRRASVAQQGDDDD